MHFDFNVKTHFHNFSGSLQHRLIFANEVNELQVTFTDGSCFPLSLQAKIFFVYEKKIVNTLDKCHRGEPYPSGEVQPEHLSTPTGAPELHQQDKTHFSHKRKQNPGQVRSLVTNSCCFLKPEFWGTTALCLGLLKQSTSE